MSSDCPQDGDAPSAERWEQRYREGATGWDLGGPAPALRALLSGLPDATLRVFVPGAGTGHDAVAWAAAGHRVVAVDYAPSAVQAMRRNADAAGVALEVLERDLFDLPAALEGGFDVIWEQTCYCAIPPRRRDEYVSLCARLLEPGGRFLGLLCNHGQSGGPPYDVTPEDVRTRFASAFELVSLEAVTKSAPGRANEFLVHLVRRHPG